MNVEGAAVEQAIGRTIMPRFHAGFSIGTVAGALGGAGCVALDISVTAHLLVVAAINLPLSRSVRCAASCRATAEPVHRRRPSREAPHPLTAWKEPRTLLIGVFVLCMAFTEGTGNDWLAVAVIDGYGAAPVARPADLRGLPRGDDPRPLVRTRPDRPPRPGDHGPGVGPGSPWSGC